MSDRPNERGLLATLDGGDCYREGCTGHLERQQYKGDDAVVCVDCDVPALRVW